MVIYKSDPNKEARIEQNQVRREQTAAIVEREHAEYAEVPQQYQLSGEVTTDWHDTEEAVLEAYNAAVAKHNLRYKRESNHYAFLDRVSYGCYEIFANGITSYQWPNPSRDHGMVYLETRPAPKRPTAA